MTRIEMGVRFCYDTHDYRRKLLIHSNLMIGYLAAME